MTAVHGRRRQDYFAIKYGRCQVASAPNLIDDSRVGLARAGVIAAVRRHDTPVIFDWLIDALSAIGWNPPETQERSANPGQVISADANGCPRAKRRNWDTRRSQQPVSLVVSSIPTARTKHDMSHLGGLDPDVRKSLAVGTQPNSRRLTRDPKYVTIRNLLRDRILSGRYGLGNRLPSESALMSQFAVSRVTVRLALGALRGVGLIESRQGKGYFVRPLQAIQDLGRLQGFGEMMAAAGVAARSMVLSVAETAASADVAKALRIERAVPVVAIHRVRIGGGTPLSYDVSYFPIDIGRRLMGQDLADADIFAVLERNLDVELAYADLRLEIAASDETVAPHLGLNLGESLIRMTRLTYDHNGRPIDFEYLYSRQDAFQFRIRVPRW